MEMLLGLIFYFLRWDHRAGFSHRPQRGWNSLFVVCEEEGLDVYIDGYSTGLQAPCLLYLHPNKPAVDIGLQAPDRSFSQYSLVLVTEKTFLEAAVHG